MGLHPPNTCNVLNSEDHFTAPRQATPQGKANSFKVEPPKNNCIFEKMHFFLFYQGKLFFFIQHSFIFGCHLFLVASNFPTIACLSEMCTNCFWDGVFTRRRFFPDHIFFDILWSLAHSVCFFGEKKKQHNVWAERIEIWGGFKQKHTFFALMEVPGVWKSLLIVVVVIMITSLRMDKSPAKFLPSKRPSGMIPVMPTMNSVWVVCRSPVVRG